MVRDDLYITIPSFFRCPISLDVMKSPVSLSTGVTYDRVSIQQWLDNGNNTCPATMQVLHNKEFVPNKTLQRLIQIWSDSVRVDSAVSAAAAAAPSQDQIKDVIEEMKEKRFESSFLSLLVRFARESEANREFLAKIDGFVTMFVDMFLLHNNVNVKFVEQVVIVFSLVLTKIEDRKQLQNSILNSDLSSLFLVLQQGSVESKIGAVAILELLAVDSESKLLIAEKNGLISKLIKSITEETENNLIQACLSLLITISMPKRIKLKLVECKVIGVLKRLIIDSNPPSLSVTEKALKLIEMVSSVKAGRVEICQDSSCVQGVVLKLLKVSNVATEHAVTILWSVCYLFRDQRAQEAVTKSNGLTKILLLMQSNCSPSVRQMSADLLKIFRVNSKSCLSSYDTKTTHIMPF